MQSRALSCPEHLEAFRQPNEPADAAFNDPWIKGRGKHWPLHKRGEISPYSASRLQAVVENAFRAILHLSLEELGRRPRRRAT